MKKLLAPISILLAATPAFADELTLHDARAACEAHRMLHRSEYLPGYNGQSGEVDCPKIEVAWRKSESEKDQAAFDQKEADTKIKLKALSEKLK